MWSDAAIFIRLSNFFFFITFASPCILKKEVVSHDGTCRAIWEISDVTLIRSRLTKQGTRSNVIDAYECIREHCTPSPLGEHFNHRCGQQRWHQCCYRERGHGGGRERVKMRTDGMERNTSWGEKKNYSVRWCKRRFAFQFDMYRTFLTRTLLWLFHVFSRGISNRFLNSYDPFDFFFYVSFYPPICWTRWKSYEPWLRIRTRNFMVYGERFLAWLYFVGRVTRETFLYRFVFLRFTCEAIHAENW